VGVVSVESTPTLPAGETAAVLVTFVGVFVIGCAAEYKLCALFSSISQMFQVVAKPFSTVKFIVRVPEA
jgi:hypothetical protein